MNGFVSGTKFIKVVLLLGQRNSQYIEKGRYLTFWLTGMLLISSAESGKKSWRMLGCAVLNWAILLLYIWPMSFRIFSIFGMLSSPLPFAGVGLEMLSFSLGFALFQAAKADSKVNFSDVELKVMRLGVQSVCHCLLVRRFPLCIVFVV